MAKSYSVGNVYGMLMKGKFIPTNVILSTMNSIVLRHDGFDEEGVPDPKVIKYLMEDDFYMGLFDLLKDRLEERYGLTLAFKELESTDQP
jgi:hypothetical protein